METIKKQQLAQESTMNLVNNILSGVKSSNETLYRKILKVPPKYKIPFSSDEEKFLGRDMIQAGLANMFIENYLYFHKPIDEEGNTCKYCEKHCSTNPLDSYDNRFCSRLCAEKYHLIYHSPILPEEVTISEEEYIEDVLNEYLPELDRLFPEERTKTPKEFIQEHFNLILYLELIDPRKKGRWEDRKKRKQIYMEVEEEVSDKGTGFYYTKCKTKKEREEIIDNTLSPYKEYIEKYGKQFHYRLKNMVYSNIFCEEEERENGNLDEDYDYEEIESYNW